MRSEFGSLVKDLTALPSDAWFEVPQHAIVFEPAPERVVARRTTTRLVLSRISNDDYRLLRSGETNTNPTEEDLVDLWILAESNFF